MSAIVPYAQGRIGRRARRGAASVVQLASGGVAADVHVERVDRRNRCSWYALELAANGSGASGRLVGVRRGGELDDLGSLEVAPGSIGSARFAVTAPRTGAYRSMYLEIRSDEMLLRADAPPPPAPRRYGAFKAAALLCGIGVAVSCAGAVPLAFAREGHRAAPAHAAALAPPHAAPAAAALAPARVLSFSARRDDAPGGETVLASYLALGERGTIALLDAAGTVVTSGPFTRIGTIRLRVPRADRMLPVTAQITVHRGSTRAVSSIALPPSSAASPRPAAPPSAVPSIGPGVPAEGVTPIDSASANAPGGLVAVEGRAVAGRPLILRVTPQASAMHVELQDESGATLADCEVAPGALRAALPLPAAQTRATYLVALHYTRSGGEETVIRTVVAEPR